MSNNPNLKAGGKSPEPSDAMNFSAADTTGYLNGVGAIVDRKDNVTDISVHTVEGQAPNVSFPSEWPNMEKFIRITGTWA